MRKLIVVLATIGLAIPSIALARMSIELRASVAVRCSVDILDVHQRSSFTVVDIVTTCNVPEFELRPALNGAQAAIVEVNGTDTSVARVADGGEALQVALVRPGRHRFSIVFDRPVIIDELEVQPVAL